MSYVRFNEPLRYFKGSSASYVFTSGGKLTKKDGNETKQRTPKTMMTIMKRIRPLQISSADT
ncbi:MAG TPA: hypothetical protein VJG90_03565 [Candidatus Nanoarchaeia archaeon]|nr:hypothetical protein [Candidatus Nanoarchaeia archaeon]